MKRGNKLAALILVLVTALSMAACGKGTKVPEKVPEELFGTWVTEVDWTEVIERNYEIEVDDNTELHVKSYITFDRDNTYDLKIVPADDYRHFLNRESGDPIMIDTGSFYVTGNRIIYNAVHSWGNSSYNIYSLEDGVLTLIAEEDMEIAEYKFIGNTAVYTKVKDAE